MIDFFAVYNNYLDEERKKNLEIEKEKRSWQLYVSIYPNFDKKTYMTYAKFLDKNGLNEDKKIEKAKNSNKTNKMTKNDILLLAEKKRKGWKEETN